MGVERRGRFTAVQRQRLENASFEFVDVCFLLVWIWQTSLPYPQKLRWDLFCVFRLSTKHPIADVSQLCYWYQKGLKKMFFVI